MQKSVSAAISILFVLGLLFAACAPAAAPPAQPVPTKEAPAATAPRPTPPPPATTTPITPTEKASYGGILKTFGVQDLSNSDLHQAFSYLDHNPMAPIYSLLVRSDPKDINKIGPDLAERWDVSPDGKTYTFFLRRGVKWHDGTPLTSADVKASFDRIVAPPKGVLSQRQAYFDAVDKIEAPDANTVRFVLKRPQAAFPAIVAVPYNAVFPKAILDQKGDMKKDMMGTGPFKFKEYIRGVQFEVEKNPDYFLSGLPYLDGVMRYIIPDSAAAKGAFVTGRLDLMQPSLYYGEPELQEMKKLRPDMVVPKALGFSLFSFIPNNDKKPWTDIRVRRAVMLALDKDALLAKHFPGIGVRGGFMPPGFWAIPTEELLKLPGWGKQTPEDLIAAKKLLAEAGYPNGFSATFYERNIREYVDQAVSFKGMLDKVGIDLKLDIRENAAWLIIRRGPNFDTMGEASVNVETGDPDVVVTRYLSGTSGNYSQYKNPKLDQLYREQSQTLDTAERKKKVLEIQRMMIEDLPFMPWSWQVYYAIHSPQVKGFILPDGRYVGQDMGAVWLTR